MKRLKRTCNLLLSSRTDSRLADAEGRCLLALVDWTSSMDRFYNNLHVFDAHCMLYCSLSVIRWQWGLVRLKLEWNATLQLGK